MQIGITRTLTANSQFNNRLCYQRFVCVFVCSTLTLTTPVWISSSKVHTHHASGAHEENRHGGCCGTHHRRKQQHLEAWVRTCASITTCVRGVSVPLAMGHAGCRIIRMAIPPLASRLSQIPRVPRRIQSKRSRNGIWRDPSSAAAVPRVDGGVPAFQREQLASCILLGHYI